MKPQSPSPEYGALRRKGIFKQFAGFLEEKQANLQESENLPPRKQKEGSNVEARGLLMF